MAINTLPTGEGVPLLIGINVLRAAGAIVDFGRDLAIFGKLDAEQIVKLERSPAGHLLLSLVEDLLANAIKEDAKGKPLRKFQQQCNNYE